MAWVGAPKNPRINPGFWKGVWFDIADLLTWRRRWKLRLASEQWSKDFHAKYPNRLHAEEWRRYHDLRDPYAEYADDDPRKYGQYITDEEGCPITSGYVPLPRDTVWDERVDSVRRIT